MDGDPGVIPANQRNDHAVGQGFAFDERCKLKPRRAARTRGKHFRSIDEVTAGDRFRDGFDVVHVLAGFAAPDDVHRTVGDDFAGESLLLIRRSQIVEDADTAVVVVEDLAG